MATIKPARDDGNRPLSRSAHDCHCCTRQRHLLRSYAPICSDAPHGGGRHPAIVLVHGAGLGEREQYRSVAEALTAARHVTLFYDKRTDGYSASGAGSRSYSLLADDVLAAVQLLQTRSDVDPVRVGLWGLSEGGGVAPLAASRSDDVAFLITMGAGGMPPIRHSAWSTENELRRYDVTSPGTIRGLINRTYSFAASAELIPEGLFEPGPIWESLKQPVLAMWGVHDQSAAPVESARLIEQALTRGGHEQYVIRFIAGADHDGYVSPAMYHRTVLHAPARSRQNTSRP